jgi:hypothetical protein
MDALKDAPSHLYDVARQSCTPRVPDSGSYATGPLDNARDPAQPHRSAHRRDRPFEQGRYCRTREMRMSVSAFSKM